MKLTDKDLALLALLQENARMPVATLARKLALSRTTVQARLDRLESEGVIAGYSLRLADAYIDGLARAYVMITVAPKTLSPVCQALQRISAVKSLHSVSGTFDLVATIEAPSISGLDRLVDDIGMIEGVERTLSSIILSNRLNR